ncbi:MAG: hypothetical protein H7A26_03440 [Spirochaetales bacterium]|nr:hypothetical protein [Spirochaetales bacterium]
MSIFEAVMIISFGVAWPTSLIKSWKSRTAKGKSLPFMLIIVLGYLSGIVNKIVYSRDIIIIFYVINLLMVLADVVLYFRNRKIDIAADLLQKHQ